MSTFVVPLDGSRSGDEALRLGHEVAGSLGAELGIVLVNGACKRQSTNHDQETQGDEPTGARVNIYRLTSEPDEDLLAWLSSLKQPIVVLDPLGPASSIASWIARHGGPSVTTLAGKSGTAKPRLRRIMVPLDGSPAAEQALSMASTLAQRSGAELGLVRIVPAGTTPTAEALARIEQQRDEAREYLDKVASQLRQQGIAVTWEVRIGQPGPEIARAAQTTATNLILMASRHYVAGADQSDSVTNTAIQAASIPVIVTHIANDQPKG